MASRALVKTSAAIDDLLGRTFAFHEDGYTIKASVTITAYDPEKGWRLDGGPGFTKEWVSDWMLSALLAEGVLTA